MTKIVMTLLVRNEIDILETNLIYHFAQGVDLFIVTDCKSDDGTLELLRAYEARGLVELICEDADHFAQGPWVTRMARLAYIKHQADWVINNDADEFWWPERGTLKSTLESVPDGYESVRVERSNFSPRLENAGPFFETMLAREVRSLNPRGLPLPSKVLHRGLGDITVDYGSHHVSGEHCRETWADGSISIFHYPMRSYRQFERKTLRNARAVALNDALDYRVCNTWRYLFEEYQHGRLPEFYRGRMLDDEQLETALTQGTHVIDTRLRDFLRQQARRGWAKTRGTESPRVLGR